MPDFLSHIATYYKRGPEMPVSFVTYLRFLLLQHKYQNSNKMFQYLYDSRSKGTSFLHSPLINKRNFPYREPPRTCKSITYFQPYHFLFAPFINPVSQFHSKSGLLLENLTSPMRVSPTVSRAHPKLTEQCIKATIVRVLEA